MVRSELREMLPTWAVVVLLPVPVATFWQDGSGRAFAYAYLFLGCAILAAERFRPQASASARPWRARMGAVVLATGGAVAVFTAFVWPQFHETCGFSPRMARPSMPSIKARQRGPAKT